MEVTDRADYEYIISVYQTLLKTLLGCYVLQWISYTYLLLG